MTRPSLPRSRDDQPVDPQQAGAASSGRRRLSSTTATLLVVANMVGTGVFTTTGFLIRDLGSPSAVLLAWVVGGLLALCGALAYSELAAAIPKNGGEYAILSRVFHPAVGFVAGWISLVVGFSAPIAASALAFGQYFGAIVPGAHPMIAAVVLVVLLSVVHALHVTMGSGVQNAFTIAKVALILVLVVGGLALGDPARVTAASAEPLSAGVLSPAFAIGLIFISFAYSGWNGAAYLAGEVQRPARTLPLALIAGTGLVMLLFLGLNFVFLSSAPLAELSGVVEVGHVAAVNLFGPRAGTLLSGVIALALVSSVGAMIMAGPRVYEAMGEHSPRLRFLRYRTKGGGPAAAVVLQAVVALIMVATATFEVLLTYIGFTLSLMAGLTVLGVMWLRYREPDLHRPYRVWGYPFTPLAFVALSGWMILHALLERPIVALAGFVTLGSGAALYALLGGRTVTRDERLSLRPE
ncbi:MAG: amino acid permease [Deltaproteobacteria bacterium]|jgi:APA family basic amino acid/polyamine antiporter|nr:amino acid permease [Deltaproteobacteria bacterium]MBW2532123.1 amino acid permease [Deltaproteobacteria bacterium]